MAAGTQALLVAGVLNLGEGFAHFCFLLRLFEVGVVLGVGMGFSGYKDSAQKLTMLLVSNTARALDHSVH